MGLEVVLEQIRQEGQKEAQRILAEAKAEAEKILAQADREAKAAAETRERESKARAEALEREIVGASEFEARRRLLAVKRELLTDFRNQVLQALGKLPKAKNEAILTVLAQRAKKDLPKGTAHARKEDLGILEKAGFHAGKTQAGSGGFIVESDRGDVLLDHRFETLLDDAWKQIVVKVQDAFEVE